MKIKELNGKDFWPIQITLEDRKELDDLRYALAIVYNCFSPGTEPFFVRILAKELRKIKVKLDGQ